MTVRASGDGTTLAALGGIHDVRTDRAFARERGRNLRSASLAFVPGSNEVLIVTNDAAGGEGPTIFRTQRFAKGTTLFSHQ